MTKILKFISLAVSIGFFCFPVLSEDVVHIGDIVQYQGDKAVRVHGHWFFEDAPPWFFDYRPCWILPGDSFEVQGYRETEHFFGFQSEWHTQIRKINNKSRNEKETVCSKNIVVYLSTDCGRKLTGLSGRDPRCLFYFYDDLFLSTLKLSDPGPARGYKPSYLP